MQSFMNTARFGMFFAYFLGAPTKRMGRLGGVESMMYRAAGSSAMETMSVDSCVASQSRKKTGEVERRQVVKGARVLVVDDELGPRESLRMLLKEEYAVWVAKSVAQALEILAEEPMDVVITDIRMPQQTGMDLLRQVRTLYPQIRVIILTGHAETKTSIEALDLGAFAYIEKPFDNAVLLEKLEKSLVAQEEERMRRKMEYLALEANRFETLGHLVSGTLHDLGTPLSVIGTHLDLILSDKAHAGLHARLTTMRKQLQHCNDLVRTTMNFLRQDSTGADLFHINAVVEHCLEVARPFLLGRNVAAVLALNEALSLCKGDIVLVRQAVLNMIYNATQAMQEQKEPRQVRLHSWQEGEWVCLAIQDSGPGVSPEAREHIFDTLYTTKGAKGTGLGLTVVKNVMQRHGGTVSLEPMEERGACFVLRFPQEA